MRIPVTPQLAINEISGAEIVEKDSLIKNGIAEKRGNGFYLTQRPSINVFGDASDDISDARGRAIYYWETASALYIFNADTIYKGSYATTLSSTPTTGTKKCKFIEIGAVLVLVDFENDQAFTITTGGTVTEIIDGQFPPKLGTAVPLAYGVEVLDKTMYVLGTNGIIYGSDLDDGSSWDALNFKEAEQEKDGGVYIGRHHSHLAIFGTCTIEFFYDATNPVGSPLNRRQDISYNIGCSSGESAWEEGDRIFFVGVNFSGEMAVFKLEQFQLSKISPSGFDALITQSITKNNYLAVGSGFSSQGHTFYILTFYSTPTDISPFVSYVYDDTTGLWGEWDSTVNGLTDFPVVAWTKRRGATERYGEGILTNGDLITINPLSAVDTLAADGWVETGWVETGWVSSAAETGTEIDMQVWLGMIDGGTKNYKYPIQLRAICDRTTDSQTLNVNWANDNNDTFNTARAIDLSTRGKLTGLGRFERRNHKIQYSGTELIRLEALEIDLGVGNN